MTRWIRKHPVLVASVALSVPIVVAAIVLSGKAWAPVLDLAMTELRVRDVGGAHSPLVGLPGRIGDFPNQGSHPGPFLFYLLAPTYRLFGQSGQSLEIGMAFISIAAIVACLVLARRRGGSGMVVGVALMLSALVVVYGPSVLTHPWNPFAPVLAWVVVLLATWSVFDRDAPALLFIVGFGSLAAQTHVPYAGLCGGLLVLAVGTVLIRALRAPTASEERRKPLMWMAGALVLGVVLWLPPLIDQLFGHGNLSTIFRSLGNPSEPPIGLVAAGKVILERFDLIHMFDLPDTSRLLVAVSERATASAAVGAIFLGLWVVAAISSVVMGLKRMWPLHATVAAGLLLGMMSVSRIFGPVWFYLTLWMIGLVAVAMFATAATLIDVCRVAHRGGALSDKRSGGWLVGVGVVATGALLLVATVQSLDARPPEREMSAVLLSLVEGADEGLQSDASPDGGLSSSYIITWDDPHFIGSQGLGLLMELERLGYDVGVRKMFAVPATRHRVMKDADATGEIRLVVGGNAVEKLIAAGDHGVVLLARVDPRNAQQRREYDRLVKRLKASLNSRGLDELADLTDVSVFAVSLNERLTRSELEIVGDLIRLGQDSAVFIVPTGYRR